VIIIHDNFNFLINLTFIETWNANPFDFQDIKNQRLLLS
jgi:hypothetical protein